MTERMSKADRIAALEKKRDLIFTLEDTLGDMLSRRRYIMGVSMGDRWIYACVFCGSRCESSCSISYPSVSHMYDCVIPKLEANRMGLTYDSILTKEIEQLRLDYDYDQAKQDDHALLFGLD